MDSVCGLQGCARGAKVIVQRSVVLTPSRKPWCKEHSKDGLDAAIFYIDMRTYGKDFEKYYNRPGTRRVSGSLNRESHKSFR